MLTYPVEMYYPSYDFNLPNMDDQILIINEYKKYINECHNAKPPQKIDEDHISVQAMSFLLEKMKQESYFKGVRDIVNLIFAEIKTPDELFASLFPDRESLVSLFKQQFLDACELMLMKDINWSKMDLTWDKYQRGFYSEEDKKIKIDEVEEIKNILNQQISIFKEEGGLF